MRVSEGYPLQPGACFICRTARPGPIIDTLLDVEAGSQDHRVYLCEVCIGDAWSSIIAWREKRGEGPGLVPAARVELLETTNVGLSDENDELRAALAETIPGLRDLLVKLAPQEVPA